MEQIKINIDSANAYIQMSRFAAGEVEEIHAILHVTPMQDLLPTSSSASTKPWKRSWLDLRLMARNLYSCVISLAMRPTKHR